jgi:peptidoglycan/LPS O-acetylase OafA/YrhL
LLSRERRTPLRSEVPFDLVYAALIIAVGIIGKTWSWRLKVIVVLVAVVAASYTWSVIASGPFVLIPYDSPSARAWECAIG